MWREHLYWNQGLFYFLATSPRVPQHVRDFMLAWGPAKDEFTDTAGWPHQLYVREGRRMIGDYVVTQSTCEHKNLRHDSIGMAAYQMDSHNVQRHIVGGVVKNEGDVQVQPVGPYPIPYAAICPSERQCRNLLVPICLSATHIAYGSIRMEPVFMVLAESAVIAASLAVEKNCAVQEVEYLQLHQRLLDAQQVLE
jgi:hypothetical protein